MTLVEQGRHRMPEGDTDVTDQPVAEDVSTYCVDEGVALTTPAASNRRGAAGRVFAYLVLPILALVLAVVAGALKWQASSDESGQATGAAAVAAATDGAIALLSYQPATVEQDLGSATDRLTGSFRDAYASLIKGTVIPDAKKRQISAIASVPGAASVSAGEGHAVVLLFVNQTVIVGNGAPTNTNSSVRVKLDRVGDRWLISAFDPI